MAGQLIPPPGIAPEAPPDATPQKCIADWVDLMKSCDKFLLAGLQREVGPHGDLRAAYRKWYAEHREEHDRTLARLIRGLQRCEAGHEPPETFVDVQVDLLLAKTAYQKHVLSRRVSVPAAILGMDVDVLSCEDLIIFKLLAGRIIDRADAAALLRANRSSIDTDDLLKWIDNHDLSADFAEIWDEAFPGESPPTSNFAGIHE